MGPSTPNAIVYGECGRFPIYVNSAVRSIKYWFKLLLMHEDRLPKKAYNMLLYLDNCGYNTWASEIRYLLFSHGFGYVWLSQTIGDIVSFLKLFKECSVNMFYQNRRSVLDGSSRYHLYREIKSMLEPEKYLSSVIDVKRRNTLVKFRAGLLKLKYNEGRWQNIDVCARICSLCNLGLEDEFHFLLVCPVYEELRKMYIPVNFLQCVNIHSYKNLVTSSEPRYINLLSYLYIMHMKNERSC